TVIGDDDLLLRSGRRPSNEPVFAIRIRRPFATPSPVEQVTALDVGRLFPQKRLPGNNVGLLILSLACLLTFNLILMLRFNLSDYGQIEGHGNRQARNCKPWEGLSQLHNSYLLLKMIRVTSPI